MPDPPSDSDSEPTTDSDTDPDTAAEADADTDPENTPGVTTESARTRWDFTNDFLALILVVSVPVLIWADATTIADLGVVPTQVVTTWLLLAAIATVWAFGSGAVNAASKLLGR